MITISHGRVKLKRYRINSLSETSQNKIFFLHGTKGVANSSSTHHSV